MVVNIAIQVEINKNENRFYSYKVRPFHPNLTVRPLAGKFYARHDFADSSLADPTIEDAILKKKMMLAKDKYKEPATTNMEEECREWPCVLTKEKVCAASLTCGETAQCFHDFLNRFKYGWYLEPVIKKERFNFHYPKKSSWITEIGAQIAAEDVKMPKKLFNGIPFKV